MTVANYKPFVERMIGMYEGGYGWDRSDPGGPTKFGITCYDLAEHRNQRMTSMVVWAPLVKSMTLAEADDIYAEKYELACGFSELNAGCDCVVFDFGVNSGPSRAVKFSQHIVGTAMDGIMGHETIAAINKAHPLQFIGDLCSSRLRFLQGLSIWSKFGRGWTARITDLRSYSIGLVAPPQEMLMARYERKHTRIHLAYAKGWDKEMAA